MPILTILIFSFISGNLIRFELGNGLSIIPIDLTVLATFLLWLIFKRRLSGNLTKPIIIFVSTLGISLLVNAVNLKPDQFLVSFLYFLRVISYLSFYFIIPSFSANFKKTIQKSMMICGVIVLFFGLIQYAFYPNLRNLYYLGWDEHLYRMFSSFLDPNFAGAFFVLYFIFLIQFIKRKIDIIFPILTFFSIVLTYSRSAYLMFLISLLTILIMKRKYKLIFVSVTLVLFVLFLVSKTPLSSEGTNLLRTASNDARLDSAKKTIIIIKDHPILGVGFNAYRFAQKNYGFISKNWEKVHSGAGTDNSYLFVIATSGLIGFLAFIFLNYRILKFSQGSLFLFPSMVGLIVDSLFINSYFYPFILLWIVVLLGLKEYS